jgi:hypothetical protein
MSLDPLTTKPLDRPTKGLAVITGASEGMGAVYADRLARRGFDLLLVARNVERLNALQIALTHAVGVKIETLAADLTDPVDLAAVEQRLRSDPRITLLVNNAGVGSAQPLLQSDVGAMQKMVSLNVTALMRLTYAAAPGFAHRGGGAIINLASIAAVAPEILNGVYAGTKAFVVAFTQSLHHELSGSGVTVQAVLPGAVGTGFWETGGTPLSQLPPEIVMSADDTVDAALAGYDQGELITFPSLRDPGLWQTADDARRALLPEISRTRPAERFGLPTRG